MPLVQPKKKKEKNLVWLNIQITITGTLLWNFAVLCCPLVSCSFSIIELTTFYFCAYARIEFLERRNPVLSFYSPMVSCTKQERSRCVLNYGELCFKEERTMFFVCFGSFKGCTLSTQSFLGQESNRSCSRQPTPQPQQHQIRATSAIYTTAHGNARSLTH